MARSSFIALGITAATLALGCREATQVTVDLSTNVECMTLTGTSVTVSDVGVSPDTGSPQLNTKECTTKEPASNNVIGSVVLVPSGARDASFKLWAIAAVGKPPDRCFENGPDDDACIIARRTLGFVPHTGLTLPIVLWDECRGNPCPDLATTCIVDKGQRLCVPALIPDPSKCETPGACGDPGLIPPDAGGGGAGGAGGASSSSSSSSSSGMDGGMTTSVCAKLALGSGHSCALTYASGKIECWGENDHGELGDPAAPMAPGTAATVMSGATDIASTRYHTCAIVNGVVKCWGFNDYAQIGQPQNAPAQVTTPSIIASVSAAQNPMRAGAGRGFSCVLLSSGKAACWGDQGLGQLNGTKGAPTPNAVDVPSPIASPTLFAVGSKHSCMGDLTSIWCWGDNTYLELGENDSALTKNMAPLPLSGVAQLALGGWTDSNPPSEGAHSCALFAKDGGVQCWGDNSRGQLGQSPPGGSPSFTPKVVQNLTTMNNKIEELVAGREHTCARKHNGDVWCWGDNTYGQLGTGAQHMAQATPAQVMGISGAVHIAAGGWHTCALFADGSLKCWGRNDYGQLGLQPNSPPQADTPLLSQVKACP